MTQIREMTKANQNGVVDGRRRMLAMIAAVLASFWFAGRDLSGGSPLLAVSDCDGVEACCARRLASRRCALLDSAELLAITLSSPYATCWLLLCKQPPPCVPHSTHGTASSAPPGSLESSANFKLRQQRRACYPQSVPRFSAGYVPGGAVFGLIRTRMCRDATIPEFDRRLNCRNPGKAEYFKIWLKLDLRVV